MFLTFLFLAFALLCNAQDNIFMTKRLDGKVLGPYRDVDLDRFRDVSIDLRDQFETESKDGLQLGSHDSFSSDNFNVSEVDNKINNSDLSSYDYHLESIVDEDSLSLLPVPLSKNGSLADSENKNILSDNSHQDKEVNTIDNINRPLENQRSITKEDLSLSESKLDSREVAPNPGDINLESVMSLPQTDDTACHETCSNLLEEMRFTFEPSSSFVAKGESLTLQCSIPFEDPSTIRLQWIFQNSDASGPQCALTSQDTLALCPHFASIEHFTDSNLTSQVASEKLIIANLIPKNSGYYICLVELTCCRLTNSHSMNNTLKTKFTIHDENYALELGVLGALVGALVVVIIVGSHLQKKRRKRKHKSYLISSNYIDISSKNILHAPILTIADDDSDDSFDEDSGQV